MSIEETYAAPVEKKEKGVTVKGVKRRVEKIEAMTDAKRALRARQRLSLNVLTAIAEGKVRDPHKMAALVVFASAPVAGTEMDQ
jgi:hypothetical protein